ncbi:restriction endonuclease subunit S [Marinomonas sp. IMCC 4694]|uniref:restriction endonuclease subunit S n=1 Tax=Marinomonas sp. IMCC 4694 TaxID=2605432 RepID=UPI0011E6BD01|nr:restriction endonuclease subunit S [Marinomonas sp. IMCC 4694]TYL46585.1 restriction endonuclease subunit S [Marinomonas sp. IMCC 4694]
MSDVNLPEGWAKTKVIDIADINPKKIDADPEVLSGFIPMSHAPTDFNGALFFDEKPWGDIKKSYTNFKDNDVIVAKVTPCFENGKAAIVQGLPNGIGAGSSEFYVIRPANQEVSTRFLFSIVKSHKFLREGAENMTGAVGLRRVPRAFVENFGVPLPPLAEQKVIADKLDTLLAQVETTKARLERIPNILKTFRQSVLAAAVSGKLTEEWRSNTKTKTTLEFMDWKWGNIPSTWKVKLFPELVDSRLGKMLDQAKNTGIPTKYIGNINVRWFSIDLNKTQEILVSENEIKELSLKIGDVLICEGGEPGRCAIWDNDFDEPIVFQKALHRARVKVEILPEWLTMNIKNDCDMLTMEQLFTGTTIKHLTGKALKRYPIRVPPLEEQTQIVRRVEELFAFADAIEQKANAALERVNNLTQSILAKAFRGELTADWRAANPELITGENSADALLAKIKAEREAMKKQPKKKAATRKIQ